MKVCFVETEPLEQEFFERELASEELCFCDAIEDVEADTEALSIFIHHSKIDARFLDQHPALRLVATRSTTHDHIDIEACDARSITVCCVGSYGDHTVTEHTFALMLALCRRLHQAMEANSARTFSYESLRGIELNGKTLGVLGAGRIGRQTLRIAKAFGMEPLARDVEPDASVAAEIGFEYVTLDELLARSHFISINLPLTPETFHMFNRETFAKCRRGVILINTARGRIIDSDALIEALDAGIVGGAGLDVLEDERVMRKNASQIISEQIIERLSAPFAPVEPLVQSVERAEELRQLMHNSALLSHPNVVFTPHIAFNSVEAIERINRATADNINAFIAGSPRNVVLKKKHRAA
jgi:D-lactate dehydrogenase